MIKKIIIWIIFSLSFCANLANSQQTSQLVYEGNLGAHISAPPGWTYYPATAEDDKRGILALYIPTNKSINDTLIAISILPSKKDIFFSEIENDKKHNLKNGAKFIGTEFQDLPNNKKLAVNMWQYQTHKSFVGLLNEKNGILRVAGFSLHKAYEQNTKDAILHIIKNAKIVHVINNQ